jgi:hypothetical protein
MTSSTADPEWQAAISTWGNAYTFAHRPDIWPQRPFTATPKNGGHPIREATPAAVARAIEAAQSGTAATATGQDAP